MPKARTDRYGHTREQTLRLENQRLKKQVSSLRKQLARLDLDRFSTLKDILEEHAEMEKEASARQMLENMKKQWECKECTQGHLEIFLYNRGGQLYYYRICSNAPNCTNRTTSKPYDATKVEGIMRKGSDESK